MAWNHLQPMLSQIYMLFSSSWYCFDIQFSCMMYFRANELHARALALREVTLALSKPKRMPKYKNAQKTGQKGASRKKVPRPFSASRVPVTGLRPGKRLR